MAIESDEPRVVAAAALRDLSHTYAERDADAATLLTLADVAREQIDRLDQAPRRDRLALMRAEAEAALAAGSPGFPGDDVRSGFGDRAVAGASNPTSADL